MQLEEFRFACAFYLVVFSVFSFFVGLSLFYTKHKEAGSVSLSFLRDDFTSVVVWRFVLD